jgi:chemotaxis protein MotB
MAGKKRREGGITIIRREEIVEGGHHGGAWKVAYADFVTAMMAFFLLMWLLNATTEDQRKGIADFFTPSNAMSRSLSGNGRPFGGRSPFEDGLLASDRGVQSLNPGKVRPTPEEDDPDADPLPVASPPPKAAADIDGQDDSAGGPTAKADGVHGAQPGKRSAGGVAAQAAKVQSQVAGQAAFLANAGVGAPNQRRPGAATGAATGAAIDEAALRAEIERREAQAFEQASQAIRAALRTDPRLAELADQLAIDETPEGLRIQLHDEEKRPMFATGSAIILDRAKLLLQSVVPILNKLPEAISISGHTDAAPFKGQDKTNWELSSERANATRRLMIETGMSETRFRSVTGNADRDPLLPADPLAAANRRIAITVLRSGKPAWAAPK